MPDRRFTALSCALLLALEPAAGASAPPVPPIKSLPTSLFTYPGNHGFLHDTGSHSALGWSARYRVDAPGWLVRSLAHGGDVLEPAVYRYVFHVRRRAGSRPGLFWTANDVVRVEATDATTGETLVARTYHQSDFSQSERDDVRAIVTFSTDGREGHRFTPRLFWPGHAGVELESVDVQRFPTLSVQELDAKARFFEARMAERFLSEGFVLARRGAGWDDYGDAATWTGLYAAAQAWRYRATREPQALERLEASLWALHTLALAAPVAGTLVRYPGDAAEGAASRDTYTGFFFALAQALPEVRSPTLRAALLADAERLGDHWVAHQFRFVPAEGAPLLLNSSPARSDLRQALRDLGKDAALRRHIALFARGISLYCLARRQRPWPELSALIRALDGNDMNAVERLTVPTIQAALRALGQIRRSGPAPMPTPLSTPEERLDALVKDALDQLQGADGRGVRTLADLKVLPSQSLHALHFLKVLAETLPKPNRFQAVYERNLWKESALLKTFLAWDGLDDELMAATMGHTRSAVARNPTRHLTFLALYDLMSLETDPGLRQCYRAAFDRQFAPMQEDFNAMLHVMRRSQGLGPDQIGVGLWSLSLYPEDRAGLGDAYWNRQRPAVGARVGGLVGRQTRDPVPLDERHRDTFIWQRSARSAGGDDADKEYPPLDFLFVYWMWRASLVDEQRSDALGGVHKPL